MADRPRFSPAEVPLTFKELNRPLFEFPKYLRDERLNAFECQAVRWRAKPQMKKIVLEKLEKKAISNSKYSIFAIVFRTCYLSVGWC